MSVNSNLKIIFRPKRKEEKWERRNLHTVEFRDLCSLKNVIRMIRPRVKRWIHAWERRQLDVKIRKKGCRIRLFGREQNQLVQAEENKGIFQNMIMISWLLEKRNIS